jgi:hypothetical protein
MLRWLTDPAGARRAAKERARLRLRAVLREAGVSDDLRAVYAEHLDARLSGITGDEYPTGEEYGEAVDSALARVLREALP